MPSQTVRFFLVSQEPSDPPLAVAETESVPNRGSCLRITVWNALSVGKPASVESVRFYRVVECFESWGAPHPGRESPLQLFRNGIDVYLAELDKMPPLSDAATDPPAGGLFPEPPPKRRRK